MIVVPEIRMKQIIDRFLNLIELNYQSNITTPTNSWIYKVYGTMQSGNYKYFDEAINIFTKRGDDPRKIATRLMFDRTRAGVPTIHITLPQESPNGNGIGFDPNYEEPIFNDTDGTYQMNYTRGFKTKYNLMITSSNDFEVLVIYTILKAIIIGSVDILDNNGLRNIQISGNDLMMNNETTPQVVYMRALQIEFMYDFTVPTIDELNFGTSVTFEGTIE